MIKDKSFSKEDIADAYVEAIVKRVRRVIRGNHGKLIRIIDAMGNWTRGEIDSRDAEDRRKGFNMISHPKKMITFHKYTEVREVYSLTIKDAEGCPSQLL